MKLLARQILRDVGSGVRCDTVNDSANDGVDASSLARLGGSETLRDSRDEGLGLEGALASRPAQGGGAQRPSDTAEAPSVYLRCQLRRETMADPHWRWNVLLQHRDGDDDGG